MTNRPRTRSSTGAAVAAFALAPPQPDCLDGPANSAVSSDATWANDRQPRNLEQLLERVCAATADDGAVSLDSIVQAVGRRSFGPMILRQA